jgi:hypothetical protein
MTVTRDSVSEYYDDPETVAAMVRGCRNLEGAVEVVKEYRKRDRLRTAVRQFLEEYDPDSREPDTKIGIEHADLMRLQKAFRNA